MKKKFKIIDACSGEKLKLGENQMVVMKLKTVTEYLVMQSHLGDNGTYFDAWSVMHETDIIKAVQMAQEMMYNGEFLGKVKKVKLEQYKVEDLS